ncbi:MAG: glycosyltransferase family 39 protein [Anaerolineae bacterium]|nr:glycosyltransferase family 39 protein [Anaerolineae bacterium]
MKMTQTEWKRWVLVGVLLLGAGLRIIGMTWGLPYQLEPDEPSIFINAWERATAGTPSLMREYPPLYPILLSWERHVINLAFGEDTAQVIFFFFGRYTSVLISVLALAMAYRVGQTISGFYTGLAFMLFLTVEPTVALEMGWIIKADNPAWLLTLCSLWAAVLALQKRSWFWLGAAVFSGILATLAKYNMALVFIAVVYAGWYLLVGRRKLLMWLIPVLILVGIASTRTLIRNTWQSDITPYFANCQLGVDLANQAQIDEPSGCNLFLTLQKHIYPFYQRDNFLDENTWLTFQYLGDEIIHIFGSWRLVVGGLLLGVWLVYVWREDKQPVWMLTVMILSSLLLFSMFEIQHPIRQYYLLILALALLLAIALGKIGEKSKPFYAGLLLLLFVPYLMTAAERRLDLRKTDSREATANYLLDNAPPGAAILVEYDKVEFTQQYGGFPQYDNYFNVIALQSIYEKQVDQLAEQGIAYVVLDSRSGNRGGYYADPERFPADQYQLVAEFSGDAYAGPDRKIYRTFRPQYETNIQFDHVATLMGYDQTLEGQTLRLTLYWQSLGREMPDYSVFIHFIDVKTGEPALTRDAPPDPNTRWWTEKQWIFDRRVLSLAELPPGTYFIRLGFYEPVSGQRIFVENGADFIDLAPFDLE